MRRLALMITLLTFLLLAACAQQSAETPPAPGDTAQPTSAPPDVTAVPPTATIEPTLPVREIFTLEAPVIPGTISAPPATEDPDAGQPYSILFERSGGISGEPLTVEINEDGSFTRNGAPGTLPPAAYQEIADYLDRLNVFSLQGSFTSPGASAEVFRYSLTVSRAGASRRIEAEDGLTPPQLMALFTLLANIGL